MPSWKKSACYNLKFYLALILITFFLLLLGFLHQKMVQSPGLLKVPLSCLLIGNIFPSIGKLVPCSWVEPLYTLFFLLYRKHWRSTRPLLGVQTCESSGDHLLFQSQMLDVQLQARESRQAKWMMLFSLVNSPVTSFELKMNHNGSFISSFC